MIGFNNLYYIYNWLRLINLLFCIPEVATVSSGSVKAGAWGREVSCGLALIPVVTAETKAGGEEVVLGEAGGSSDLVGRRHGLHSYLHPDLSFLSLLTLPYGGGKLESVRHRSSEKPLTA